MTRAKYILLESILTVAIVLELAIDFLWYPFSTAVNFGYIMQDAIIVDAWKFYLVLAFYLIMSIPCYVIAIMLAVNIKQIYTCQNVNIMAKSRSYVLVIIIDLMLFLIGNIVLDVLSLNNYSIIYYVEIALSMVLIVALQWKFHIFGKSIR